jgi:hypothetical protein
MKDRDPDLDRLQNKKNRIRIWIGIKPILIHNTAVNIMALIMMWNKKIRKYTTAYIPPDEYLYKTSLIRYLPSPVLTGAMYVYYMYVFVNLRSKEVKLGIVP